MKKRQIRYVGPLDPVEYPAEVRAWDDDEVGWATCRPGDVVEVDEELAVGREGRAPVIGDDGVIVELGVTAHGGLLDQADNWQPVGAPPAPTKAELVAEIERRNADRDESDRLPTSGTKDDLVAILAADDEKGDS